MGAFFIGLFGGEFVVIKGWGLESGPLGLYPPSGDLVPEHEAPPGFPYLG